ncbi:unnamed protein product [Caenorhabditis nigoni]
MVASSKRPALLKKVVQSEQLVSQKLKNNEYQAKRRATLQSSILQCISCQVCTGIFGPEKRARVLPCKHTICEQCVTTLMEMAREGVMEIDGKVPDVDMKCPFCRKKILLCSAQSARSLMKNRTVMTAAKMFEGCDLSEEPEVQLPLKPRYNNATCKTLQKRFKELEGKNTALTAQTKREITLIENLEEKAGLLLNCPNCQQCYEETPILIRCGHTVCIECWEDMKEEKDHRNFVKCPTCNTFNRIHENSVSYYVMDSKDKYVKMYL